MDKSEEEQTTEQEFSEYETLNKKQKNEDPPKKSSFTKEKQIREINQRNMPFMARHENVIQRTIWTILLLIAFVILILAGHFYCLIFVFWINVQIFNEIISLKRYKEKDVQVPMFLFVNWYFFLVGVFFFYGKILSQKLAKQAVFYPSLIFFMQYHNLISFILWIIGFLVFVISLKKGFYRYQFRLFAWTHITLILIVGQTAAIVLNMYEGLIWFVVPCCLVITNDIFAYIVGKIMGRTRLIELSPKKTWEGFIGGLLFTLVFALIGAHYLAQFSHLVCPQTHMVIKPFVMTKCSVSPIFFKQEIILSNHFQNIFFLKSIWLSKFQLHTLILCLFASLISPFGGFFSSGFKRAIKIKDYGDMIPGHGGLTDRMDCQLLMGMFTYLYLHQVIIGGIKASRLVEFVVTLSDEDQLRLFNKLGQILAKKRIIKQFNFNSTLI